MNYANMNLKRVTIFLPDNLYAIASGEAGEMGVERYLEHLIASHFYEGAKTTPKEKEKNAVNHESRHFSTDGLPDTVLQIHAIVRHMHDEGLSFRKAVKVTASEFNVNESTIRDKCTRRITISTTNTINTDKFLALLERSENLVNHLCQKFPDHRQAIVEKFKPILSAAKNKG